MRKSEVEEKVAGALKASRQKFITWSDSFILSLTEAYILLRTRKITKKKKQNQKLLQGIKWEDTKNCNKKAKDTGSQQCRMNEQCCRMNSACRGNFATMRNFFCAPFSLYFLLFFPSGL